MRKEAATDFSARGSEFPQISLSRQITPEMEKQIWLFIDRQTEFGIRNARIRDLPQRSLGDAVQFFEHD